ncbi:MAG: hypothetical protein AAFZ67_13950 [Planctomycetota bacterium]
MPRRVSTALNSDASTFAKYGVFDGFIDADSLLHVDPHLLASSAAPEMRDARIALDKYFQDLLPLVKRLAKNKRSPSIQRALVKRLQFPEYELDNLGYAAGGGAGRGVGRVMASRIANTAVEIVDAGVEDPRIFELVGAFEDGFGADLVSDMVLSVCRKDFARYTARVAKAMELKTHPVRVSDVTLQLPGIVRGRTRKALIFYPNDVLRELPVAMDWQDVGIVASYNEEVRQRLNKIVGDQWGDLLKKKKREVRRVVLQDSEVLRALVDDYKDREESAYDFVADPMGEVRWFQDAVNCVSKYPFDDLSGEPLGFDEAVERILDYFKYVVEEQDVGLLIRERSERYAQRTFSCATALICEQQDLDLAPETDKGRGPVDFKLSRGRRRTILEFKLSSNTSLKKGYESQLEVYASAENTERRYYVIFLVTDSTKQVDDILKTQEERSKAANDWPKVFVIDAREKPSASKVRSPKAK